MRAPAASSTRTTASRGSGASVKVRTTSVGGSSTLAPSAGTEAAKRAWAPASGTLAHVAQSSVGSRHLRDRTDGGGRPHSVAPPAAHDQSAGGDQQAGGADDDSHQ